MGTIGNLAVNVVANTEKFSRGMKQARSDATMFGKSADSLKSTLLGLGGVLATGFAAKFSFDAVRQAADDMDRLAKSADTLGASTRGLGGLQRTAELAGSTGEAMSKAMQFMERNLANADDGFGKLGLDIQYLQRLRPEVVFMEIADAIKGIPDPGKRLQFAKDILGKGSAELMPTILGGSQDMRLTTALQSGFSRADARTVEEANDAATRLGHTFKDLEQTMAIKFGPAVAAAAGRLNTMMGGANPTEAKSWQQRLNGLDDAKFIRFMSSMEATDRSMGTGFGGRQNFGGATSDREAKAVREFFGDTASDLLKTKYGATGYDAKEAFRQQEEMQGLMAAVREREQRVLDDVQKRQAKFLTTATPDDLHIGERMRSAFDGLPKIFGDVSKYMDDGNSLIPKWAQGSGQLPSPVTTGYSARELRQMQETADEARSRTPIRDYLPSQHGDMQIRGNAVLEEGTAAAFTQSRRSQQAANQMLDVTKQQLKSLQKAENTLQSIDKNLRNNQVPTINIA